MKVTYEFATGEVVEVEATEDIGEIIIEFEKSEYNSNRRETRRHNSISDLEEQGAQFADENIDIHSSIENQEINQTLYQAMEQLLPQQQELIIKIFFEGRKVSDIAREEGVYEGAIRNRLRKIYKKLKIFLD